VRFFIFLEYLQIFFDLLREVWYNILITYGMVGIMRILGIDPGLATIGWGVLDYSRNRFTPVAYGSICTKAGLPVEERLNQIYESLSHIIEKYAPETVSIEELFWNTNITTGIVVAEARGTILLCAHRHGLPIYEYTPMQVKQAVVGYGKAEKKQVISMVTMLLGLKEPPKPDDTADAIAIAICHAHSGASALRGYYNRPTAIGGIKETPTPKPDNDRNK